MKKLLALILTLALLLGLCPMALAAEPPAFTALEFLTSAFVSGTWTKGQTYSPAKKEYDLPFKAATTTQLTFQATTVYDTEAYTAAAVYLDESGETVTVPVNSGKITYLKNLPFGETIVTLTLAERENEENKTVYTLRVTRPWDETKTLKATSGITVVPDGRALSAAKYQSQPEGTVFRADEWGVASATTGTADGTTCYRAYLLGTDGAFSLTLTGKTAYTRLRYSTDDGSAWTELPRGGGTTEKISFPAEAAEAKVLVEVLDDKTYTEKGGFSDTTPTAYTLWVERVNAHVELCTATVAGADAYPAVFDPEIVSNVYVVPNGTTTAELRYTAPEGASVTVGKKAADAGTLQTPEADGSYKIALTTAAQYVNVTKDGVTRQYDFKLMARSAKAYADKVVDYLCPNSQYTNVTFGVSPETTLCGTLKSLGNWGGYITYYFDEPLRDDPRNKFGMDFYVYGNSAEKNIDSMAEAGQVWVSEDGKAWYALAGSEHYEDDVFWDYTVEYRKTENGKTAWTDNKGNSNDGTSRCGNWLSPTVYYMNELAKGDSFTLKGILLSCQQGSVQGDSSNASYAHAAKFGYADYYANGTVGEDYNPYIAEPTKANGFDLAWAVDEAGMPVDVSQRAFHYVKVVTASNIWAGSFAEKSTECAGVVRTTAQEEAVGKTTAPTGVTISDGTTEKTVTFADGQQVYEVELGEMKTGSLTVNGTDEADNIYVNHQRVASGSGTELPVTEKQLVRILVQNGDREPVLYFLKFTGGGTVPEEKPDDSGKEPITPATKEITVYFTLLGDEKHGQTEKPHTAKRGGLTTWIARTAVKVTPPASVLDVVKKALDGTFSCTGSGNYISEINGLSEFDNGPLSGWMYTVNGRYSELGVGEQMVKAGDSVVFHYTDDYTAEKASENWSGASAAKQEEKAEESKTEEPKTEEPKTAPTFTDVPETAYYRDAVLWAVENGVTAGTDATHFSPDAVCTRAQTVTFLWRAAGCPKAAGTATFTDVPGTAYYHDAVLWAAETGITRGTGGGRFSPEARCTRGQIVTFLYQTFFPDAAGDSGIGIQVDAAAAYLLKTTPAPRYGSVGGEWAVLGLARSGAAVPAGCFEDYTAALEKTVAEAKGVLSSRKYTEYSRVILALTALGRDAKSVAGYDLTAPLQDFEATVKQGNGGAVWALIALDSGNYPSDLRQRYVDCLLNAQNADGGWGIAPGSGSDADMTAMAVQALANYREQKAVTAAVEKAFAFLGERQTADGGMGSCESTAQTILALCAWGLDPADEALVKNGHTLLEDLAGYAVGDGGYRHIRGGEANAMASEQALLALTAVKRAESGLPGIYEMQ